jgi:hypothetical protein
VILAVTLLGPTAALAQVRSAQQRAVQQQGQGQGKEQGCQLQPLHHLQSWNHVVVWQQRQKQKQEKPFQHQSAAQPSSQTWRWWRQQLCRR